MRHDLFVLPAIALSGATLISQAQPAPGRQAAGPAAAAPARDTVRGGFSVQRLERIDALLQQYVDENRIGGAVALVLRDGQPVYEKAVGWADKEANRRMTTDTIFRIASQTKAITSVGVLALVEEGKIGLNDPVSRFIPAVREDDGRRRRRERPATDRAGQAADHDSRSADPHRRHLVRHRAPTSRRSTKPRGSDRPPASAGTPRTRTKPVCDTMERLATLPFVAQPGEALGLRLQHRHPRLRRSRRCRACRSTCSCGRASPIRSACRTRRSSCRPTSATVWRRSTRAADGALSRAPDGPRGQGNYVDGPRRSFAGGAGLLSTARDYARFLEMIRNGGALDGVRILAPRTVALMTHNQIGTLHSTERLRVRARVPDDRSRRRERPRSGGLRSGGPAPTARSTASIRTPASRSC